MTRTLRNTLIGGGLIVALAIAFSAVLPERVSAEDATNRLISVSGEASVEVKPDMATLSFGVENTAVAAQDAQRENSLKMNAVIDALKASGVSLDDIQTSNFSLYPVYEYESEVVTSEYTSSGQYLQVPSPKKVKQVLTGYRCNNTVVVRLKDTSRVGYVIDATISAGATNIGGISFGIQNPEKYKNDMLAAAVQNAKSKGEIMARAAGVTITGLKAMHDGYASVEAGGAGSYKMVDRAPSIEAGSVTVRASVRIDLTF